MNRRVHREDTVRVLLGRSERLVAGPFSYPAGLSHDIVERLAVVTTHVRLNDLDKDRFNDAGYQVESGLPPRTYSRGCLQKTAEYFGLNTETVRDWVSRYDKLGQGALGRIGPEEVELEVLAFFRCKQCTFQHLLDPDFKSRYIAAWHHVRSKSGGSWPVARTVGAFFERPSATDYRRVVRWIRRSPVLLCYPQLSLHSRRPLRLRRAMLPDGAIRVILGHPRLPIAKILEELGARGYAASRHQVRRVQRREWYYYSRLLPI